MTGRGVQETGAGGADSRRVALYLPDLFGGGAERMMVAIAKGLVDRGVQVDVVLAYARGPYLDELPPDVRLVDLRSPGVLASVPRLARYLRQTEPEAVLVSLPHASIALVLAARLARSRSRIFIRESTTPSAVKAGRGLREKAMPLAMRIFYPRADGVIAVSKGVASDLRRHLGLSKAKISTIYNPVVTDELTTRAQEEVVDPWFRAGEPPVVLSVGRLVSEKCFDTLIRAVGRLQARRETRLVILGEGPEREGLERLIAELGLERVVKLPGFEPNPFRYMARASVYALSSEREGLPGALIQAMACGCPVVSTDCPSGPAEVLDGGRFGELVPVGDVDGMADALDRTLRCPPPKERSLQRARLFSAEESIDSYMELLLGGRSLADG